MTSDKYLVFDSGYRGWCNLEATEQKALAAWINYKFPDVNWFHVANEGKRLGAGKELKEMGMKKGVSDVVILTSGECYKFGVIELKRKDRTKSRLQHEQSEFMTKVIRDGGFAAVAYGLDEAKKAFIFYMTGVDS